MQQQQQQQQGSVSNNRSTRKPDMDGFNDARAQRVRTIFLQIGADFEKRLRLFINKYKKEQQHYQKTYDWFVRRNVLFR